MKHMAGRGLTASAVALVVALSLNAIATAQQDQVPPIGDPSQAPGLLEGAVIRCVNGAQQPAVGAAVGVEGGSLTAKTDQDGHFFLALPPGQWTVVAVTSDGSASRPYVPVESNQLLEIGVLEIGGGMAGCGPDSDLVAPVLPTFTPTATAVPEAPTPTPAPTAQATPTPMPMLPAEPEPEPEPESDPAA
jgi:hypothetical protein